MDLAQKWIEQTRSLLDKEGHGPALDNTWAGHTLSQYPVVRVDDYSRLSDDRRIQTEIKNKQNVEARYRAFFGASTKCFWVLHQHVLQTAPAFARHLEVICDRTFYDKMPQPNQMDGARAWKMIIGRLYPPTMPDHLQEAYEGALTVAKKYHLPDGCSGEQFEEKANAVMENVLPNLERPLTGELTTKLLVNFLPVSLKSEGIRLLKRFETEGKLSDHEYVISECVILVAKYQAAAPVPVSYIINVGSPEATALIELAPTPEDMLAITGATFIFQGDGGPPTGGGPKSKPQGGGVKWCSSCVLNSSTGQFGHRTRAGKWVECQYSPHCENVPGWLKTKPDFATVEAKRKEHAKQQGIPYKPYPKPTQKELDAAKEAELKRKARSAAGVAVEASDVERWLGDFEEIVPMAPVQVEAHDCGGASCVPAPPGPGDAGSIPVPADANPSCLDTRATLEDKLEDKLAELYELTPIAPADNGRHECDGPSGGGTVLLGVVATVAEAPPTKGLVEAQPMCMFQSESSPAYRPASNKVLQRIAAQHAAAESGKDADQSEPPQMPEMVAAGQSTVIPATPQGGTAAPVGSAPEAESASIDELRTQLAEIRALVDEARTGQKTLLSVSASVNLPEEAAAKKPIASQSGPEAPAIAKAPAIAESGFLTPAAGATAATSLTTPGDDATVPPPPPVGLRPPEGAADCDRNCKEDGDRVGLAPPPKWHPLLRYLPVWMLVATIITVTAKIYGHSNKVSAMCALGSMCVQRQLSRVGAGGAAAAGRRALNALIEHADSVSALIFSVVLMAMAARVGAVSCIAAPDPIQDGAPWYLNEPWAKLPHLINETPEADGLVWREPPRVDLLTHDECASLWKELSAGHEPPPGLPESITRCLVLADTGCGTDLGNHEDQFETGSIYDCEVKANGGNGAFATKQKGTWRMPFETEANGVMLYRRPESILHPPCPYALMAPGRASKEAGVSMWVPSYGQDGYLEFPGAVRIVIHNISVTVIRPLGYKVSPPVALSIDAGKSLGIPHEETYFFHVGAGRSRAQDLPGCCKDALAPTCVPIDLKRGGIGQDCTRPEVGDALIGSAGSDLCIGAVISLDCTSFSSALMLPKADGTPGKPYRQYPDYILGIPRRDGTLPAVVANGNLQCEFAAELYDAINDSGGFVMVEAPVPRAPGRTLLDRHAIRGAVEHVSYFDHPAWKKAKETGTFVAWDQCMTADDPSKSLVKSTCWLVNETMRDIVTAAFGPLQCNHGAATHAPLRSKSDAGYRPTDADFERLRQMAEYSAGTCTLIAECVKKWSTEQAGAVQTGSPGDELGLLTHAVVIYGKKLPEGVVDGVLLELITHYPKRDQKNLHKAWCNVPPSWAAKVLKSPCDSCLRANAPRKPPSGELPKFPGLYFLDIHYCSVEGWGNGCKNTVGVTHSTTGMCKFITVKRKNEAGKAMRIISAYCESTGNPIRWIHTDGCHCLKGSEMIPVAREHNWRITTTNVGSSNQNPIEPVWRATMSETRKHHTAACHENNAMPLEFWQFAWEHGNSCRMLRPSRLAPHTCILESYLKRPVSGRHLRPWGCLGYYEAAPRYPGGTLVNKVRAQARRGLCLGYAGGMCSSFEGLLAIEDRSQPGYIMFDPELNTVVITDDVTFVPKCQPGLRRVSGGGYEIPTENIPFIKGNADGAGEQGNADGAGEQQPPQQQQPRSADGAAPGGLREITTEDDLSDALLGPEALDWKRGFAEDALGATERGGDNDTAAQDPVARDEVDMENAKEGEPEPDPTGNVGKRIRVVWSFDNTAYPGDVVAWRAKRGGGVEHRVLYDNPGGKWAAKDIDRWHNLSKETWYTEGTGEGPPPPGPTTTEATAPAPTPAPPAPPKPTSDRPQRERAEPNRLTYAVNCTVLAAQHAEFAKGKYFGPHTSHTLAPIYPNIETELGRIEAEAAQAAAERDLTGAALDEYVGVVRDEFNGAEDVGRRAILLASDYSHLAAEYGESSPQAILARELYAASAVAAANMGVVVPTLEPLLPIYGDPSSRSTLEGIFDAKYDGGIFTLGTREAASHLEPFVCAAKGKGSPHIFNERQMRGPEWDDPKTTELNKLGKTLHAYEHVTLDDPRASGLKPVDTMWAGVSKPVPPPAAATATVGNVRRKPDGTYVKLGARLVLRGDIHKQWYNITPNDSTAPVLRHQSNMCVDAVACLGGWEHCGYDYTGAYLQGDQQPSEQVLARAPVGFRTYDERGCEFYWLMSAPLYGQADAGAIWNRTVSKAYTDPEPEGLGFDRCPYDPCIYSKCVDGDDEQRVTTTLYVDDGRAFNAPFAPARAQAKRDWKTLSDKFLVKFGEPQPKDDYFLGADRAYHGTKVVEVSAATYIGSLTKRYLKDGSADSYPSAWTHTPASEELQKLYDAAIATRPTPEPAFQKRYASLYGSLLHAVKYRPEIAAAMGLCGTCAAICTEGLYKCLTRILVYLARSPRMGITYSAHAEAADELCAYADSNWATTRSTSGFFIRLAGATISSASRRQHCVAMSSTEAELIALADCAIELLAVMGVTAFLGRKLNKAVRVYTDNKGAYDLCHRFTTSQHSRHIDRKVFKMRELRGAGVTEVHWLSGLTNPADLFTKILTRQAFETHRRTVLNLAAREGEAAAGRNWNAAAASSGDGEI